MANRQGQKKAPKPKAKPAPVAQQPAATQTKKGNTPAKKGGR